MLKNVLFEPLTEEIILQHFGNAKVQTYKKGEFIFQEGETPVYLDLLIEGNLQLFKYDSNSNEITLGFFSPISLIAELASLCNFNYPASARFFSDGKVTRIPINSLRELIVNDPKINHFLIQCLLEKLQTLNLTISRSLTMDAQQRVAHFLYYMPDEFPELKHNQIASMLLIRAETFSRTLKEFKDIGAIESTKGHLKVLNRQLLTKYFVS